jgi:dUTP pyrophosphatase
MDEISKIAKQLEDLESMFDDGISELKYDDIMSKHGLDLKELEKDMETYQPTMDLKFSSKMYDPNFAYPTDSGMDLYSTESLTIEPFGRSLIPTGVHFDVPENYEIQVRSKSGLAIKQGLMVLNSPGTVDQGYTGEIKVILFNTTNNSVEIKEGQKIAQAVLCPVVCGKWLNLVKVDKIKDKDRSNNGFGSTGI